MFYDVHKENMFTINLGDKARKKGAKRLEFLVPYIIYFCQEYFLCKLAASPIRNESAV